MHCILSKLDSCRHCIEVQGDSQFSGTLVLPITQDSKRAEFDWPIQIEFNCDWPSVEFIIFLAIIEACVNAAGLIQILGGTREL